MQQASRQQRGSFRRIGLAALTAATAIASLAPELATAQAYPSRPLRMIVPFSPGGAADILARTVSEPLGRNLGQSVLVINRDGGGTVVGVNEAARASPDGYTMLLSGDAAIVNAASRRKLPYDLFKDLTAVSMVYSSTQAMVVRRSGPYNTLQDVVKYGRDNPGQIKFGSVGVGSAAHMSAELFNQGAGIRGLHVPYRGAAPALNDLAGGQFDYIIIGTSAVIAAVKGGQFRSVAVMSKQRSPQLPDVPTSFEQGVNVETGSWYGLYLTGGAPAAAVTRVQTALKTTLSEPAVMDRFRGLGGEGRPMTQQEFTAFMKGEVGKFAKLIKDLNIKLDE
jgi:tripartite-type tricarboxylate transporter receptor subunit TctC